MKIINAIIEIDMICFDERGNGSRVVVILVNLTYSRNLNVLFDHG